MISSPCGACFVQRELKANLKISDLAFSTALQEAYRAEREGDYAKVAELRYGKIKELQEQLSKEQAHIWCVKILLKNSNGVVWSTT